MSSPPPIKAPGRPFERHRNPPPRDPGDDDDPRRMPPWVRRELIVYGVALLFGLVGVPLLIWVGGNRVLGPYTHGENLRAGPLALLQDFFQGLLHGSAVFWVVALGPAVLVVLVRVFIRLVRAIPDPDPEDEPPAASSRRAR